MQSLRKDYIFFPGKYLIPKLQLQDFSWFWEGEGKAGMWVRKIPGINPLPPAGKNLLKLVNREIFKENTRNSCPGGVGILGKAGSSFLPFVLGIWKKKSVEKINLLTCDFSRKCWDGQGTRREEKFRTWIMNLWCGSSLQWILLKKFQEEFFCLFRRKLL